MIKPADFARISGVIDCEAPNNRLYKFDGKLTFANNQEVALSHKNVLLRVRPHNTTPVFKYLFKLEFNRAANCVTRNGPSVLPCTLERILN